jgi:futalosine hydrolase
VIVVCFATPLEGERLVRAMGGARGRIAGRDVTLLRTGVGPVNAAHALTLHLAREKATAVLACGVGGAYPGSGLQVLDVVCAETETYGDLGARTPDGFLDMEALGVPVIDRDPPLYNRLALSIFPVPRRAPFVTCTTCTGTEAAAREIAARTGGAVESMEGAAIVHVCLRLGAPVGEVRAISNLAGNRDRASWRLAEAAAAAQEALLRRIEAGPC